MLNLLLIALGAAAVGFALLYFIARAIDNYGIVDVGWAAGFTPLALWYGMAGDGTLLRRGLLMVLAVLWSGRLAWHLGRRVGKLHPVEDGRYQQLRRDWAGRFGRTMFLFFQGQALALLLPTVPWVLIAQNTRPELTLLEGMGMAVTLLAIVGESFADRQLNAFKRDPANRGRVCDGGLWRYSRHPNYFFEWLVWVGFALAAFGAPNGWLGLISPALMLFLLLRVTGIPYTEQQLERSKGSAYRAYCARTSRFIPWPPAHVKAHGSES